MIVSKHRTLLSRGGANHGAQDAAPSAFPSFIFPRGLYEPPGTKKQKAQSFAAWALTFKERKQLASALEQRERPQKT